MASLHPPIWKPFDFEREPECPARYSRLPIRLIIIVMPLLVVAAVGGPLAMAPTVDALRMINLDAPDSALQGDTIQLGCSFHLKSAAKIPTAFYSFDGKMILTNKSNSAHSAGAQNVDPQSGDQQTSADIMMTEDQHQPIAQGETDEQLYAVKWYKDEREFFRYLTKEWPKKQSLPLDGLFVDLAKSDNNTVVLRNISLKTSGLFRCEVSTDAPQFVTKSIERQLIVYSLPDEGPRIERHRSNFELQLFLGDHLDLACSSPESKPAASLDWIINDNMNLSAGSKYSHFKLTQRRLVRLPTLDGLPLLVRGLSARTTNAKVNADLSAPKRLDPNSISYATYEIRQDNSLLTLINGQDQHRIVEPSFKARSMLAQLVESSQTRLNLSVDADLFGLLLSQRNFSNTNRLDYSKPPGSSAQGDQFVSLKSHSIQVIEDTNTSVYPDISGRPAVASTFTGSSGARRKATTKSPSTGQPSNMFGHPSNYKQFSIVLRVKCVSRVLHLLMSDELKVRIFNRTRTENDIMLADSKLPTRPQPRQGSESSGTSSSLPYMVTLLVCQVCSLLVLGYL